MVIPVVDLHKLLKNPQEISTYSKTIQVDKIIGLIRPIDRPQKYLGALKDILKDEQKRNHLFNASPIDVYEYDGNYYVLNGNHRCYLFKKYKDEIGVEYIPARIIKIVEGPK